MIGNGDAVEPMGCRWSGFRRMKRSWAARLHRSTQVASQIDRGGEAPFGTLDPFTLSGLLTGYPVTKIVVEKPGQCSETLSVGAREPVIVHQCAESDLPSVPQVPHERTVMAVSFPSTFSWMIAVA